MPRRKFREVKAGESFLYRSGDKDHYVCCGCGLSHIYGFSSVSDPKTGAPRIKFTIDVDARMTAAIRRYHPCERCHPKRRKAKKAK